MEEKVQLIHDRFGEAIPILQRYTIYKHRNISIRIDEPVGEEQGKHTVMTLGENQVYRLDQRVIIQHAIVSNVTGDAHAFINSLNAKANHTWIEKGFRFKHDDINIKLFHVLNIDQNHIDPDSVAISIEALVPISQTHTDNTCNRLLEIYKNILGDVPAYKPFVRGLNQK